MLRRSRHLVLSLQHALLIALALGCPWCVASSASPTETIPLEVLAQAPAVTLSNDRLSLKLYLPDAERGFYRGTRFDWAGVIGSLRYREHEYFAPWFHSTSPAVRDVQFQDSGVIVSPNSAALGPVEEFNSEGGALGYADAAVGGLFLKIGVGVLRRPDDAAYSPFRSYPLVDAGKRTQSVKSDRAEFTQTVSESGSGHGYRYTKVIRLEPASAVMHIDHELRNTGAKTISTLVYNHNFFNIDGRGTTKDLELGAAFPISAAQLPEPRLAEIVGSRVFFRGAPRPEERVAARLGGFANAAIDHDFRLIDWQSGAAVRISGDRPLARVALWAIQPVTSIEPFIEITVAPGETFRWSWRYEFSLEPARSTEASAAPSNVYNGAYPRVHADGRVTFRVLAPSAQTVQVQPGGAAGADGGLGKGPYAMQRDAEGIWTVTTPPAQPGFHYYWLLVDGVPVNDPASTSYFGYNKETSGIEIPEPVLDFYQPTAVPHGQIRTHWYYSQLTSIWRKANVYTPPGYDSNARTRYPVLYLRHGGGENAAGWVEQGQMHFIMDNLLSAGRIEPMLVVMDHGYAYVPGESPPVGQATFNPQHTLVRVTLEELLPTIDANFRTIADREHRAMAGLSMGSRQTQAITLGNLDKFAWIGAFSRPLARDFNPKSDYSGAFKDAAAFNSRVRLLWFSAGTAEVAIHQDLKHTQQTLERMGIEAQFVEFPGMAHEWQPWRKSLYEFAQRLFRQPDTAARR